MKSMKSFKLYTAIWVVCFALFNLVTFAVPFPARFSGTFWIGYIFISITFLLQLACAYYALKTDSLQKTVYNIPIFKKSITGLILMIIAGLMGMIIPSLPMWLEIIICSVVLAGTLISLMLNFSYSEAVESIDKKIKTSTFVMKSLVSYAQHIMAVADTPETKIIAKKVYEAIRFSDFVSNAALEEIDTSIQRQFAAFEDAVSTSDIELSQSLGKELLNLIDKRNKRCRLLK